MSILAQFETNGEKVTVKPNLVRIGKPVAGDLGGDDNDDDDERPLLLKERQGDVISSNRALLTLAKGFVGSGCLSLPYAWKQGGLWMAFVLQIVISCLNWYSNHILSKASQELAVRSGRPALDYGHFAKKVFDYCGIPSLERRSKLAMYVVNGTVMIYQLGCCAVPIVFVCANVDHLVVEHFGVHLTNLQYASILLVPLICFNMIAQMRWLSWLAALATLLWTFGVVAMLQECFRMPNQWATLPAATSFWSTIVFFGTAMYAYEGQTMILPIENKLRHPSDFTATCGVLSTVMALVTIFYTALGFFGYTAYGEATLGTLPLNMPDTPLFTWVTIALTIMAFLAHPINLYVVFDMFWSGFRRKSIFRYPTLQHYTQWLDFGFRLFWVILTYLLAISVPRVEQIVSLVGVTAGSLCAFCFPTSFEILIYWNVWQKRSKSLFYLKLIVNGSLFILGIVLLVAGFYINVSDMLRSPAN